MGMLIIVRVLHSEYSVQCSCLAIAAAVVNFRVARFFVSVSISHLPFHLHLSRGQELKRSVATTVAIVRNGHSNHHYRNHHHHRTQQQ